MKTRILVCLGWIASGLACGWAFQPPAQALLPNFDSRTAPATQAAGFAAGPGGASAFTPAQREAVSGLQQRVSGLVVEAHGILGSPRLISSNERLLTGPGGVGGGVSAASLSAFPAGDPHRVIKAFLNENAALFGHNASVLDSARIKRDEVTAHNGLRTVIWEQTFQDIPVFQAQLQAHITRDGALARMSSLMVPNVESAAASGRADWSALLANPTITPAMALSKAAANVGDEVASSLVAAKEAPSGSARKQTFTAPLLKGDSYAQLVWLPDNRGSMRLCWQVVFMSKLRQQMFRSVVDAQTGEVLVRHGLTFNQAAPTPVSATYRVYTSDSPSPFSPGLQTPGDYQPPIIPRTLTNITALSSAASPAGWLDPANANGAFETKGNNVDAHTDRNDDDLPDLPRPSSRANPPVFDFPLDLTLPPSGYTNAAVVNLFFWNNFMHDKLYDLGFTEAAGNFQNNNFSRGGEQGDAVQADAQDGMDLNDYAHFNNANFSAPPDGIAGRMQMYVFDGPQPDRDGDLDAEVMCHEYTHGLSIRLVGGGLGITALQTAGMGEGWSDFYALSLLSQDADDPNACYASGGYASYMLGDMTENYYYGIRRYPYSTDMNKNPLTFKDIDPTQADSHPGIPISPVFGGLAFPEEVHNQGEVWCVTLWEARAKIVDAFGWDEGNRLTLQLVTDGMKLAPLNPTFLEARDAILQADVINNGSANRAELWTAFAKRGMGLSARAPQSDTTIGVVEAYDVPEDVIVRPPTGALDLSVNPAQDATLFGGTNATIFLRVRDGIGVTNATVKCTLNGSTDLAFNNTARAPDARARDSIYSGYLTVPTTGTNLTLFFEVSAPGKTNATLTVNYFIATLPSNDFFTGSIKVKAAGGALTANNRFATLEPGEPVHAGVTNDAASLWWTWTPTNNSRVLVDTAGSSFRSIIAVYTGSTIRTLKEVKSVSTVPQRKQGYLFFDAVKGVTYQIVVASKNASDSGQLRLRIAPDGQPDITAPVVTVQSPISGTIVSKNFVDVLATAVDPEPEASGVDRITFRVGPLALGPGEAFSAAPGSATNRITLTPGRNEITVVATDVAGNTSDPATITVTYRPNDPPNDHFTFAAPLLGVMGTNTVSTAHATREPGEPRHAGNDGGASVWWIWTAPTDGTLLLSTEGSTLDTLLGLYTGNRVDSLTTVAENDDAFDGVKWSKIRQAVRSNVVYHVAVDGFNGTTGQVQLAYSFSQMNVYTLNLTQTEGGQLVPAPGLLDFEANSSVALTAIPDPGYDFISWQGDIISSQNPLSAFMDHNRAIKAVFSQRQVSDDFESGALTKLPWTSAGAKGWVVSDVTASRGKFSARSGPITNSQTSSLLLKASFRGGTGGFDYRVSSEPDWDVLSFYVDGVLQMKASGEVAWTGYPLTLSTGDHTLEWRYTKDAANSAGLDSAFIDNVDLPINVPVDATTAARLSITALPGNGIQLFVRGQTNQVYIIQGAWTFPAQWIPLSTNEARQGEILFSDPLGSSAQQRFYRAIKQ